MKRNKLIQRRAVVALCCLLLLNIAVPGLVYARQVWSPFDHTIVALRDQYRFGGIWTQQGINWFQANQQWLVTLQRHRYWWESETRAPESHIQRMVGPDPTTTPFFYSSVVWNSITSSGIPEHRLEADEEEVSHQTRRPDLLVASRLYTAAVLMRPGNIANFAVTFESELTDWGFLGGYPPTIIDQLGWGWIPGTHHWVRP